MNAIVKQMAAALEIPSEVLYKQFSTSYSAARGALNEYWRTCGMHRDWFADNFCRPIYEACRSLYAVRMERPRQNEPEPQG